MGKNCQEHKILMQKAIQNEIHSVRGNGRDNEDQPVTGNGRENEDHPVRGNRRENEDHPVSGSSNRDKIPIGSEIAMGQFREIMESREINTNV